MIDSGKIKIVFVHSSLGVGGAEILRKTVCRELLKRGMNFSVCLIGKEGFTGRALKQQGVNVNVLGANTSIYDLRTPFRLYNYFRKTRPDIVQSSQFNSNFHTRIAASFAGIPVVICEEHGFSEWKQWWHKIADRVLARMCSAILAVSEAVKQHIVSATGVSETQCVVIHNCVGPIDTITEGERGTVRKTIGISSSEYLIGHVGTLRKEKGHDTLLRAFKRLRARYPVKLVLIGDGPLYDTLVKQIADLGISKDVILTGTRNDITGLMSAMDCFVFPSISEGLGIALLEAMAAGLPVVASDTGGIPEIVENGQRGILVKPGCENELHDSLECLIQSESLREMLGKASLVYMRNHHTSEGYVDQLLKLYRELLRKAAG